MGSRVSTMASRIGIVVFAAILSLSCAQQVLRVRGRPRNGARAIAPARPKSFAPVPVAPLVSSCPEPFGLQLYPDPTTCNRYFKCANGTLTHETCENGLLFDRQKAFAGSVDNHCAYNWDTNCDERPADNTPTTSPGCPYQVRKLRKFVIKYKMSDS